MTSAELLTDAFGRVQETVHEAVDGLSAAQLAARLDQDANSIAWLCWHLARVQDDHLADAFGVEQVWPRFMGRFGLPFGPGAIGYGDSSAQVAVVRVSADVLTAYHDAVHEQTVTLVSGITDADLSRVVDERWNPPVTLGVRLISVISDCLQHAGQAAFIRGIMLRADRGLGPAEDGGQDHETAVGAAQPAGVQEDPESIQRSGLTAISDAA